jgi:hypothetical protein
VVTSVKPYRMSAFAQAAEGQVGVETEDLVIPFWGSDCGSSCC